MVFVMPDVAAGRLENKLAYPESVGRFGVWNSIRGRVDVPGIEPTDVGGEGFDRWNSGRDSPN